MCSSPTWPSTFDLIAQDVPVVGSHIGLGIKDHLFAHTKGYKYTMPLGPSRVRRWSGC